MRGLFREGSFGSMYTLPVSASRVILTKPVENACLAALSLYSMAGAKVLPSESLESSLRSLEPKSRLLVVVRNGKPRTPKPGVEQMTSILGPWWAPSRFSRSVTATVNIEPSHGLTRCGQTDHTWPVGCRWRFDPMCGFFRPERWRTRGEWSVPAARTTRSALMSNLRVVERSSRGVHVARTPVATLLMGSMMTSSTKAPSMNSAPCRAASGNQQLAGPCLVVLAQPYVQ